MSDDTAPPGDELSLRFKTFTLTNAEANEVTILGEDIKLSEDECRRSLIGKVVTSKPMNLHGIKNTMGSPSVGQPLRVQGHRIGDNLFQFVLGKEEDVIRVLAVKPWFFNIS
ncbi:hypothetical protein RHGRI_011963 [Rhododendron griersonianum]|uniref:DUF4283 domain-containing protein n=1 Tax=Rhododendron griersonianum TaxID=479676 RepID=A0AAV6KQ77_9ERIC|nr:hypothetical protein RHGRI_011963 [Rhododendron griersonianum]